MCFLVVGVACGGDAEPSPTPQSPARPGEPACLDDATFFERKVWAPFMGKSCLSCHSSDGSAVLEHHARLVLERESAPMFLERNREALRRLASEDVDGRARIVVKATGGANHGGGAVLAPASEEARSLTELVQRLRDNKPRVCPSEESVDLSKTPLLSSQETFRKAAVRVGGRLPTVEEHRQTLTDSDAALEQRIGTLLDEPGFLVAFRDLWNDVLLVRKDRSVTSLAKISPDDYPASKPYALGTGPALSDPAAELEFTRVRAAMGRALSEEPLALIAHVVRNNLPFSEILTADYTVANPYSAFAYGLAPEVPHRTGDEDEFRPVRLQQRRGSSDSVAVPHAGILTTHAFLSRWPTTPTNKGRGRARVVYRAFLGTDVMKIAPRPVDAAAALTSVQNAPRESPTCSVCHSVIDPVAGAFRGWDELDNVRYFPQAQWHDEMVAPGFEAQVMPGRAYPNALPWLARAIVTDPRFARSVVETVFSGIVGRRPLTYPHDVDSPTYARAHRSWRAEQSFLQETTDAFEKANLNVKVVVRRVVMSPFFRAAPGAEAANFDADLFQGRKLLTNEQLSRKVQGVFGFPWGDRLVEGGYQDKLGDSQFYLYAFGGIDSGDVTARVTTPNAMLVGVQHRLATEMACRAVAWDFTRPPSQRALFPFVEPTTEPGTSLAGEAIERNIVWLFQRLYGQTVDARSPEVARAHGLLRSAHASLVAANDEAFPMGDCRGHWDRTKADATGVYDAELPPEARIDSDPRFVVRAWTAVVTHLLMHPNFIME